VDRNHTLVHDRRRLDVVAETTSLGGHLADHLVPHSITVVDTKVIGPLDSLVLGGVDYAVERPDGS
jgi:hypothetical protein